MFEGSGFEEYAADMENGDERVGYVKELVSIASDPSAVESLDGVDGGGAAPWWGFGDEEEVLGHAGLGEFLEGIKAYMSWSESSAGRRMRARTPSS